MGRVSNTCELVEWPIISFDAPMRNRHGTILRYCSHLSTSMRYDNKEASAVGMWEGSGHLWRGIQFVGWVVAIA